MTYFVRPDSIVRRIWGNGDTILLIFAGAAAEFALNKAVDWLYFTGRLPADPLARLFSTVTYARRIVFSEEATALKTIDAMAHIHAAVEEKRGSHIPDWAYRDVLFMLIDYSMRSFEVLERRLGPTEREEVFRVFNRVGKRMGVRGLPDTLADFDRMRQEHLTQDLTYSRYTADLYARYRYHLGLGRYLLLREAQLLVIPHRVARMLGMRNHSLLHPLIWLYKLSRHVHLDRVMKRLILPPDYQQEIRDLDVVPATR
jgi:hypothetical protein